MPTRWGTILRYLLIIATIALAPPLLSSTNPRPAPPPAPAVPPALIVTQSPPPLEEPAELGSVVPPISAQRIRTVELGLAMLGGDPKPTSIMAVTTTLTQALRDSPDVRPARGSPPVVYLAVMKGSFAYSSVSTLGMALSTGHYISIVFAPVSLTPLGWTVSGRAPAIPLSRLGPVIELLRIP